MRFLVKERVPILSSSLTKSTAVTVNHNASDAVSHSRLSHMFKAQVLHASLLKTGLQNHVYRCNLLLQSYAESGGLSDAHKLLRFMLQPNVVSYNIILSGYVKSRQIDEAQKLFSITPEPDSRSWNIVISGCIQNQRLEEAMTHFVQMRCSSNRPDSYTYSIIIPSCDLEIGRQIHADITRVCSCSDVYLGTNLLRMYAEAGEMEDANRVFDGMTNRDLVTWNALISCYSKFGKGEACLQLFRQLVSEGIRADHYTYAIILNELTSRLLVFEAMQVHSLIIKCGYCSDCFTSNTLVNLYSNCGYVAYAAQLFEEIPERNVVSWTAMIVGLSQNGHENDAMWLFDQMRLADVEPNSFTLGGLLNTCANSNAFERGKRFHGLVLKFGLESDVIVGSAIVDMYSKCGEMNDALRVFQIMPERDIASWNAMICGFAQNGEALKALNLFDEMVQSSLKMVVPNHVTFIGVLSACGHNGLVEQGRRYFNDMINKYLIKPKEEHYTCMVDMLARAGLLDEAEAFILGLPLKPDSIMWGALLGACKLHGNLDMARRVAEHLYENGLEISSNYVLLANTFASIGEWVDASGIREAMQVRGTQKVVGCSWIEIQNSVHSFIAADKYHPQIDLVYEVLQRLSLQMEERHD
ncbi:PREDICTED: pentatricopeptide repeat-containing protein At2g13600-like [Nelumbo nucifera]|uniref:Pentatricopeptide repeat-containing protein At2g13600-like n=2 Tax=Nelumbo nucifera TaxID=4432 RepID=A0A822ZBU0_NELNU|nr:PREDICTED: pentatricopeptide repeat-containing protein At2g13600-like [Nelumbo nucifera]DAD42592.1 TPA_asm: hypothetical protein HUJ06_000822 [Nelumbo nucifera]